MKKFRTIMTATLLISILTLAIILCACTPSNNNDEYVLKFYEESNLSKKTDNYSAIIKSVKELDNFCNQETSPYFQSNTYGTNQIIIDKLSEYDKDFFKDKSLIILFRFRPYAAIKYNLDSLTFNDTSLDIVLSTKNTDDDTPAVCGNHIYILEFAKEKIADITQVNVTEIKI